MDLFTNIEFSVLFLIKIVVLVSLFLYIIFAAVVIKQVRIMTETIEVGFETPIKTLSYLHFLASLFSFVFAILIL